MAQIVKIKCNGAGQHVNDVDLDRALEEVEIYKSADTRLQNLPKRDVTLRCQESGCTGRIVITRLMLEEMLGADHA
jgi:hypothetical protein